MSGPKPPSHAGYVGACVYEPRVGVFFGHVVNVRRTMIPFRFRQVSAFAEALRIAVDHYLAACRLAGVTPERPVRPPGRQPGGRLQTGNKSLAVRRGRAGTR